MNDVLVVPDNEVIWVVGEKGSILHGHAEGATWEQSGLGADGKPATTQNLRSVSFSDGMHGWAVGDKGTILATADGGKIWQRQTISSDVSLLDVQFLADGQRGWTVGGPGTILTTTDGDEHWQGAKTAEPTPAPEPSPTPSPRPSDSPVFSPGIPNTAPSA